MIAMFWVCVSMWVTVIVPEMGTLDRFGLGQNKMMGSVWDTEFGIAEKQPRECSDLFLSYDLMTSKDQ